MALRFRLNLPVTFTNQKETHLALNDKNPFDGKLEKNGDDSKSAIIGFAPNLQLAARWRIRYIKVGSQYWRNITSTGNLTWSGQQMIVSYNTSNTNVATGTTWRDCTITMKADGKTIDASYISAGRSATDTWTKQ